MSSTPTGIPFNKLRAIIALALSLWLVTLMASGQAQQPTDVGELPPNQTLGREMTGAGTHRYKFNTQANEFVQVRVEQKGVDVALKLMDASGNVLATMDSPNGKQGTETLSFVPKQVGSFILEVSTLDANAEKGSYTIQREAPRTATVKDGRRVEVEQLFVEGMAALSTAGQQEVAWNKLEEAVRGWEELQDAYLTELTALNLFFLANRLPQDMLKQAQKLLYGGTQESLIESRRQSFKALELFRRFYQQLDGTVFTEVLAKYNGEKASFKLTTKFGEINTLSNIANTYSRTGDFEESLKYSQLAITSIAELRSDKEILSSKDFTALESVLNELEASLVSSVGSTLSHSLDKPREALGYLNRSLTLFREIQKKDESAKERAKLNEVVALQALGSSYSKLDNLPEALRLLEQALALVQTMPNQKSVEASILQNITTAYFSTFNYEKSLLTLNRMLKTAEETGDKALQADALSYIKTIYFDLGDEKALREYSKQEIALLLSPEYLESFLTRLGSKNTPALSSADSESLNKSNSPAEFYIKQFDGLRLIRIGNSYKLLEEYENALKYYEQALTIALEIKASALEGIVSTQIADLYVKRKQWDKAIEYSQRSLALERQRATKSDLALSLRDVGYGYLEAGRPREALSYFNESLALWHSLGADKSETIYRLYGTVLSHLSRVYDALGNRKLAIMFGKLAVNATQRERGQLHAFDRSLQASFLKKNEKPYRRLADWLIEEGRFAQAEQVLRMLKEEEYSDFVRRDSDEIKNLSERLKFEGKDKEIIERYNQLVTRVSAIGEEYFRLDEKQRQLNRKNLQLPAEEQKRYAELKEHLTVANAAFKLFLDKTLVSELGPERAKTIEVDRSLQDNLRKWGNGTVALYTVVGEDRYRVILTTPTVQVDGKYEIKAEELNKKIFAFRDALQNPKVDPMPLGKELYDILIKPIEKDLQAVNARTLIWSLDGTLRYIPLAALSADGKSYLVEKYQNVIITPKTSRELSNSSVDWRALGVGVSQNVSVNNPDNPDEKINFKSLPGTKSELMSIVKDEDSPGEKGVLAGKRFLDEGFTVQTFTDSLKDETEDGQRKYTVIHIASHFRLGSNWSNSFLLLGNGKILSLQEINNSPDIRFGDVELITLSACNTAFAEQTNGKEVDSLAEAIQTRSGKAVLATLWSVADSSTSLLMSEFYRLRKENPKLTKAGALQQAQQEMLAGNLNSPKSKGARRDTSEADAELSPDYSHPYYWSPFVLIGNWK
jgi:CHAT domain-containing protein/tetratricopeptide (TPR) repeat protein